METSSGMTMPHGLSVVMPAFNESAGILASLGTVSAACSRLPFEHEIIVVDDCSTDDTPEIARRFAEGNPRARVVRNERNLGYGGAFIRGVHEAKYAYSLLACADEDLSEAELHGIMMRTGQADLVLTYTANPEVRPFMRRAISRGYTASLNALFGLSLKYYNGHNILPTERVKKMKITKSYAYSAQIVVRLLRQGVSYREYPMVIQERQAGVSKAFRPRNIASVAWSVSTLFLEKWRP